MIKILILVLLILNMYDLSATYSALGEGISEANIVVDWVIVNIGFVGLGIIKLGFIGILYLFSEYIRSIYLYLLLISVFMYSSLGIYHYYWSTVI